MAIQTSKKCMESGGNEHTNKATVLTMVNQLCTSTAYLLVVLGMTQRDIVQLNGMV